MSEVQGTRRRDLLKTALYVTPVILTFPVAPAAAKSGSERGNDHPDHDYDYKKKHYDYDDKKKHHDDTKLKGKSKGGKDRD